MRVYGTTRKCYLVYRIPVFSFTILSLKLIAQKVLSDKLNSTKPPVGLPISKSHIITCLTSYENPEEPKDQNNTIDSILQVKLS